MPVTQEQLDQFHRFATKKLSNGGPGLTMGKLLVEWRAAREREDVNTAIRQGLTDIEAGRVRPAEEVMQELRKRYNLPLTSRDWLQEPKHHDRNQRKR